MDGYCIVCGKDGKIVNHHTNYKENKTIKVCPACHRKIHTDSKYSALKPIDVGENTMILIHKKTALRIKRLREAKFGDTYDSIIVRWLDKTEKK